MAFRKKIIVFILIISFLGSPFAYKAQATDWFAAFKFSIDTVVKIAVHSAFKILVNRILSKVRNAGIDGGPAFVQNWRKFKLESQYRGEDIWRGILYVAANGEDNLPPFLCNHIKESDSFKSLQPTKVDNLIKILGPNRRVDSLQEYLVTAKCDDFVNQNYDKFSGNFAEGGGWEMLEKMLEPKNNIFGAIGLATDELKKQGSIEKLAAENQALTGEGFTAVFSDCLVKGPAGLCLVPGKIKTPGSSIKDSVSSVFDTTLKFYTTAEGASGVLAFITDF
ncbi:MAG: hypothetical protein AAB877_01190, partial [Patescibacteria group bacterium]